MLATKMLIVLALASSLALLEARKVDTRSKNNNNNNNSNFCQGCRSLVSYATHFNESSRRDEMKDMFRNFCELQYPASTDYQSGPCPLFVESLFYLLDHIDPIHHCDQIGACSPISFTVQRPVERPVSRSEGPICKACQKIIAQAQAQLTDPKFVEELKQEADQFCDFVKVVVDEDECKQVATKYVEQAIDFFKQLDPEIYCQTLQLCSQKQSMASSKVKNSALPSLIDFEGFGIETSVKMGPTIVKDLSNSESVGKISVRPDCKLCKLIVTEIFKHLKENRTVERIKQVLDKVCVSLHPQDLDKQERCEDLINAYTNQIVELISEETDPELICMLLDQCTSKSSQQSEIVKGNLAIHFPVSRPDFGDLINMLDSEASQSSLYSCVECKVFISYLREKVGDVGTEEAMRDWLLKNLCNALEDPKMKDSCSTMVNNYSTVFFQAVAKDLDPARACVQLGACRPKMRTLILSAVRQPAVFETLQPIQVEEPRPKSTFCDQCTDIVSRIDDYLSTHPIDSDVSVLIEQVCNKIPNETGKQECTFLVKSFGESIVRAIANMGSPREVCESIKVC